MYHTHIYLSITFVMPNPRQDQTCWSCGLCVRLDMKNGCHPIVVDLKGIQHDTGESQCTKCANVQPIRYVVKQDIIKLLDRHTALQCRKRMADEKRASNAQAMAEMRAKQAEHEAKMQAERAERFRIQLVQELKRYEGRTIRDDIRKFSQFLSIKGIINECPLDMRTIHGLLSGFVGDLHHSYLTFGNPDMETFYTKLIKLLNCYDFKFKRYDESENELSDDEEGKPRVLELLGKIPVPVLTNYPYTRPMLPSPVYSRQENTLPMIELRWQTALAAALERDEPETVD